MADLKRDLDTYLARNDKSQSQPLLSTSVSFSTPDLKKWFSKTPSNEAGTSTSSGWMSDSQKDCCPTMSRMQRITGFGLCVGMGMLCFILSAMYAPVLILKARKFALLFTMGSLFIICSFSFLWGPMHHLRHLFSRDRLPFTIAYFGTLFATLFFALSVQSTPLTALCAVGQVVALIWFLISYIPGGQTGLKFFTRLCSSAVTSSVSNSLPV